MKSRRISCMGNATHVGEINAYTILNRNISKEKILET
jgi:hypothetical protein